MAIHDTMQYIRPRVGTVCIGQAASMGSFLLSAGEPGMRVALTNARIMIHQPSGGFQGSAADIEVAAKEILHIRGRLNGIIAKHTGKTVEAVAGDVDRDRFMDPVEAVEYGLIDRVLEGPVSQTKGKPADSDSGE